MDTGSAFTEKAGIDTGEFRISGEETFKQLIKNSFDMIVLLDANGIQRFVSESCRHILGYTPGELMDIPVMEKMIHPDDREKVKKAFSRLIHDSGIGNIQYRHKHKKGHWVYLETCGSNQLSNPAIQSVILNVRDITERKRTEEALTASQESLKELNAAKDRFFSIIGHDLKGPFNHILGFSNVILNQIQNGDLAGTDRYARIIRDSSAQALELLTNLLEWSLSQTGSITFEPEKVSLLPLVNEVIHFFSDPAELKSVRIKRNIPADLFIEADKGMLKTILRNLISNGIKFTPSGGQVLIDVDKHKDGLIVCVSDTGIGLKDEEMDTLFSLGNRYSRPGTDNESGTGLGLLLCKEFVEMHGGGIWAKSNPEGGTTFCFTIKQPVC
ncbi:PAS domain-containing sensor histidine kinase [Halomonas sp.]|uniref:PAS domain-containing sensor histidine kinase n=1 Tax=Halomonas sp. TaxID=1486246 RepID=UPI0025BE006F|nr:PAS domain-containing sensor histidine kinase [Halomonas sp.]